MACLSSYITASWVISCLWVCSPKKEVSEQSPGAAWHESPTYQPFPTTSPKVQDNYWQLHHILQKMILGDSVRVVCWGNSITYGFRPTHPHQRFLPYPQELQRLWQQRYRNPFIEVINLGHPGWRSEQALTHISEVLRLHPDLCFVHFGINDALSNYPFSWYAHNLEKIAHILHQAGIEVVFLCPTPILQEASQRVASYAQQLPTWCAARRLLCIDIYTPFQEHLQREHLSLKDVLLDDIHPDAPYYRWIAQSIINWWTTFPQHTNQTNH